MRLGRAARNCGRTATPIRIEGPLLGEWLPKRFAPRLCETGVSQSSTRTVSPTRNSRRSLAALKSWADRRQRHRRHHRHGPKSTLGGRRYGRNFRRPTMQSRRVPGLYFIGEVVGRHRPPSAATTSNGPGPQDMQRAWPSSRPLKRFRAKRARWVACASCRIDVGVSQSSINRDQGQFFPTSRTKRRTMASGSATALANRRSSRNARDRCNSGIDRPMPIVPFLRHPEHHFTHFCIRPKYKRHLRAGHIGCHRGCLAAEQLQRHALDARRRHCRLRQASQNVSIAWRERFKSRTMTRHNSFEPGASGFGFADRQLEKIPGRNDCRGCLGVFPADAEIDPARVARIVKGRSTASPSAGQDSCAARQPRKASSNVV